MGKKETKDGVEIETTESLEKNGDRIIVTKKTETKVLPSGDKKTTITTETKTTTKAGKTSIKTQTETKTEKKGEKKEEKKEEKKVEKVEEKSAATVGKPVVKKETTKDGIEIETTESLEKNGDRIIVTKKTETKVLPSGDKKTTITTETKTTTKAGKTTIQTKKETKTQKKGEKQEEKKEEK